MSGQDKKKKGRSCWPGVAVILCIAFLAFLIWVHESEIVRNISRFFNVSAAVVSALGVVAYNLRNRVVDFSRYLIDTRKDFEDLAEETIDSCRYLTRLVFFSFISGILCMLAGVCENIWMMGLAGCAFIGSTVAYVHILFSFDKLEGAILNTAVENRRRIEKEKRKQYIQDGIKENPDNF